MNTIATHAGDESSQHPARSAADVHTCVASTDVQVSTLQSEPGDMIKAQPTGFRTSVAQTDFHTSETHEADSSCTGATILLVPIRKRMKS